MQTIVPVDIPDENTICNPSGRLDIKSGLNVTPKPKPIEVAIISKFLSFISTYLKFFIPAAATVPNITIPTPPSTGCGIPFISAANLGNNPSTTRSIPAITATCLLATLVNGISPTFWLNEVFGNAPTTPPNILPTPSASTPEPTLLSFISTLDTSPIAFKHPTVSIVVTKYAGKNAINAFKSNVTPYSNILV